jgi:ubiquinone biosynthesis protein COQ9
MDDADFDRSLITAAFQVAAEKGWRSVSTAAAARAAGLPLARARERFPGRTALLLRFGRMTDLAALADVPTEDSVSDRLEYLLMRRFDVLQPHRAGVLALLRALPTDPPAALLLALTTRRSMRWMLEAVGVSTSGVYGLLRVKGLMAVWLWAMRTWQADDSEEMHPTEAALHNALLQAERAAGWFGWRAPQSEPAQPEPSPPVA